MSAFFHETLRPGIRAAGVLLGVVLFYSYWTSLAEVMSFSSVSAAEIADHAAGLMFAAFLMFPWKYVTQSFVWWPAYFMFIGLFLKTLWMSLMAGMWAAIHGAKSGDRFLVMGVVITVMQLIVIWTMRPKRGVQVER